MFLTLYRDEATLYRDAERGVGGAPPRVPRLDTAPPLLQSAAAGALAIAGWAEACERARREPSYRLPVLVDPMCGSGTILIEAALMAGAVAPRPGSRGREPRGAKKRVRVRKLARPRRETRSTWSFERPASSAARRGRSSARNRSWSGADPPAGALCLARRAQRLAGVERSST